MRVDWWTLALQAVNFAILVWLLQRFLYKPVLRLIDARRTAVEQKFQEAHNAEAKANEVLSKAAEERAGIAAERVSLLKAAEAQSEQAAKARRERAEREADELLETTRKTLAKEREQALAAAREAALDLSTRMACRLVEELPPAVRAEAWLERLEQHLANLPKADLDRILRDGAAGSGITVVTAAPLPAKTAALWRERLGAQLGGADAIKFESEPALIAGAELRLPNAVLRLSWRSALDSFRSEILSDADTR